MKNRLFIIAITATVLLTACGKTSGNDSQKTASIVSEESSGHAENSEESSEAQSESSEESESSMAEKKKEKTKSDSSKASKEKNDSNTTIIINEPTYTNSTSNQNGTTTNNNTFNYDDSPKQDHADTKKMFEDSLNNVSVEVGEESIVERGVVNGQNYSLIIDLSKWEKFTTTEDMVQLSRLFWQSYPKMYERYADITDPPVSVILAIENEGYEIAEAGGDFVHLHDQWLYNNPDDYDCIVHELGHIIQVCQYWEDDILEYDSYSELFADVCRMEYAMDNGYYNDNGWSLQTADEQDTRETSVRFLVWLDYMYSKGDIDIMRRFCAICYDQGYSSADWDNAWQEIFKGTALEGKTADEAWEIYKSSDFAYLSSYADKGEISELLQAYDIRGRL